MPVPLTSVLSIINEKSLNTAYYLPGSGPFMLISKASYTYKTLILLFLIVHFSLSFLSVANDHKLNLKR